MNEGQAEQPNTLEAQGSVPRMVAIELCTGHRVTEPKVLRLSATFDPANSGVNTEALEILNQELVVFRQDLMHPVMGTYD